MTKQEVISMFCALANVVMLQFGCIHAADCFCGDKPNSDDHFSFAPEIMNFINDAIQEKIQGGRSVLDITKPSLN